MGWDLSTLILSILIINANSHSIPIPVPIPYTNVYMIKIRLDRMGHFCPTPSGNYSSSSSSSSDVITGDSSPALILRSPNESINNFQLFDSELLQSSNSETCKALRLLVLLFALRHASSRSSRNVIDAGPIIWESPLANCKRNRTLTVPILPESNIRNFIPSNNSTPTTPLTRPYVPRYGLPFGFACATPLALFFAPTGRPRFGASTVLGVSITLRKLAKMDTAYIKCSAFRLTDKSMIAYRNYARHPTLLRLENSRTL